MKNQEFMPHLVIFVVVLVSLKFLFDGVTIVVAGHTTDLGHMDPMAYVSILAPVLGTHGYIQTRPTKGDTDDNKS